MWNGLIDARGCYAQRRPGVPSLFTPEAWGISNVTSPTELVVAVILISLTFTLFVVIRCSGYTQLVGR